MRTYYFNIQSKGGAGKSMLTYLQALQQEDNERALFVDMDSSSMTSTRQLAFLKPKNRLYSIDLNDNLKRIDREKIFSVLEEFSKMETFESFYLDFGATESQQLSSLLDLNLSSEDFVKFQDYINSKFVFNIVLAGGGYYKSCMAFAFNLINIIQGKFPVYLYINQFTFQSHKELIDEVNQYYEENKNWVSGLKLYGDIYIEFESGKNILKFVREGMGLKGYEPNFITKLKINHEIAKV